MIVRTVADVPVNTLNERELDRVEALSERDVRRLEDVLRGHYYRKHDISTTDCNILRGILTQFRHLVFDNSPITRS